MAPTMRTGKSTNTEGPLRRGGNGFRSYHRRDLPPWSRGRYVEGATAVGRDRVGQAPEPVASAHPHLPPVRGPRQVGPTPRLGRGGVGERFRGHHLVEKPGLDCAV